MNVLAEKTILHLCNEGVSSLPGWENIVSMKQLDAWKGDDSKIVWLINAHLNWDGNDLSDNYGFTVTTYIRLVKKSKSAVILYSPIKKKYFETKSETETKYLILFGRGTGYIEAPFSQNKLNDLIEVIPPLSNASLHDVSTMLCNLKGIVFDRLNHDLKFGKGPSAIDKVIKDISPYLSNYQRQQIEMDSYVKKLKELIKIRDEDNFFIERQNFLNLCTWCLSGEDGKVQAPAQRKYKILLLEDDESELKEFCANLQNNFEIIPVTTAENAKRELEKDSSNSILSVISDWRLYIDKDKKYWQNMQGYEVLELAANKGMRALFALSSQADFIVHQIRNLMGVRFLMFKKENLRKPGQWQLFITILNESCEFVTKQRSMLLDNSAQWTKVIEKKGIVLKSLKQQYIDIWNAIDRDDFFEMVGKKANEMLDYIYTRKGDDSPLNEQFGIHLSTKGPFELFPVLVYRRVWIALWFKDARAGSKINSRFISSASQKIYNQMFSYYPSGSDASQNAAATNYKLCVTPVDVHHMRILPEEEDWLINRQNNMG